MTLQTSPLRFWPLVFHPGIACMLLWALRDDNPYSYYSLLRLCATAFFLSAIIHLHAWFSRTTWVAVVTALALYNPLLRPRLDKETWSIINLLTLLPVALTVRPTWKELE